MAATIFSWATKFRGFLSNTRNAKVGYRKKKIRTNIKRKVTKILAQDKSRFTSQE